MELKRNRTYKFMTVKEIAEKLHSMGYGDGLDFTFDSEDFVQEPTGWFGFKKVLIFDEPYGNITMGDYGASASRIYSVKDNTIEEITEIIQFWLDDETGCSIEKICVEVPAKELWKEFGEVAMNPETECIETEWNGFPIGTHREDIWHWFEEHYGISVAEKLMGL